MAYSGLSISTGVVLLPVGLGSRMALKPLIPCRNGFPCFHLSVKEYSIKMYNVSLYGYRLFENYQELHAMARKL